MGSWDSSNNLGFQGSGRLRPQASGLSAVSESPGALPHSCLVYDEANNATIDSIR